VHVDADVLVGCGTDGNILAAILREGDDDGFYSIAR
jgi:hypothetical protein